MLDARREADDEFLPSQYHLKALAIVQCPWREVLFLDSDNSAQTLPSASKSITHHPVSFSVPTRDPTYLFSAPAYLRLGALFFPDYWKTSPANPIWQIIGIKARDEWEQEAGQILFDKGKNLDAMVLTQHMLEDASFWYNFSDGDKDVFRFAMLMLRKRWAVPGRYVGVGGLPSGTASGDFCGLSKASIARFDEAR